MAGHTAIMCRMFFVFGMDGTIRICGLNAPGMMYDSTLADYGNVYKMLEKVFEETGGKVVVDSAFLWPIMNLSLSRDRCPT
jgi:hypothetical protein